MKNRKKSTYRKELNAFFRALEISLNLYSGHYGLHRLQKKRLELLRDSLERESTAIIAMVAQKRTGQENVSHHIKVNKEGISYLDVILDGKNKQLSVAVKFSRTEKHTGYFKRATEQILLRVDADKQTLMVCPVVSIKPRNKQHSFVIKEAEEEGGVSHTCVSHNGKKEPKRLWEKRVLQENKGQTLCSRLARIQKMQSTEQLVNILHYMKQIGDAFTGMHKSGITHFDAKSDNILFKWINTDEKNIPYYTLIDRPGEDAAKNNELAPYKRFVPSAVLEKTGVTWGRSIPHCCEATGSYGQKVHWGYNELKELLKYCGLQKALLAQTIENAKDSRRELYGHAVDSYAYLYSFYEQICGTKELGQIFRPFLSEKIAAVLREMQHPEKSWPPELTVERIQQDFARFCTEKNLGNVWQDVCDTAEGIPAQNSNQSLEQMALRHKHESIVLTEYLKEKLELNWCYTWTMWLLDTIEWAFGSKKSRKEAYQDIKSLLEHGHENSLEKIREAMNAIDVIIHKGLLHDHDGSLGRELRRVKDTLFDMMVQMCYSEEQKPVSVNHLVRLIEMKKRLRRKLNTLSKRRRAPEMKWGDDIPRSRIGGAEVRIKKVKFKKLGNHSVGFFSEQPTHVMGKEKWKKP